MLEALFGSVPAPMRPLVRGLLERFNVQITKADDVTKFVPDATPETEIYLVAATFDGKPVRGSIRVG